MFSNVFQELSVSPSLVNLVTNLCKNGIHTAKFDETHEFCVQNLAEFYFTLKFYDESKIRPLFPNIPKFQKQNS